MFSSANALRRQIRMGGLQLLNDASEGHGAKVRLLISYDVDGHKLSTVINEGKLQCPHVAVRSWRKTCAPELRLYYQTEANVLSSN